MTDTPENAGRHTQTQGGSVGDNSSKRATDFNRESDAQHMAEVSSYPVEIMPVGDPRPQN